MKTIINIFFGLFTFIIIGQTKNTTSIIVNGIANKEEFVEMLIENNNFPESESYGVLTTKLRETITRPGWTHQYHYQIQFKDDTAIIKPYWSSGVNAVFGMDPSTMQWKYRDPKKKGNIYGIITNETLMMLTKAGYLDITYN